MNSDSTPSKNIFYPPGGILLWIIIFLELLTFGIALIVMTVYSKQEPDIFHQSRLQLNTFLGTLNTCFLLCSGYFMAEAVRMLKHGENKKSRKYLQFTIIFGLFFIVSKCIEYYQKIEAGINFSTNQFFSFYWSLTIFHLAHVIAGLTILLFLQRSFRKNKQPALNDFEAGATFWHLCDLIWLLIFPTLYLLF